MRTNIARARACSEMLDKAIANCANRSLTTAQIIADLVDLAMAMRDAHRRGEALGLRDAEVASYDAIVQYAAAVFEMGDDTLTEIARQLVTAVRGSEAIDWNLKDS